MHRVTKLWMCTATAQNVTDYFALLKVRRCVVPSNDHTWLETLKSSYRGAQMVHHPDKLGQGEEKPQESILLNAAYETLKDPHERLKHILNIHNQYSEKEAEKVKTPGRKSFLFEMLELNERFDNAVRRSPVNISEVKVLQTELSEQMRGLFVASQKKYEEDDFDGLKENYLELSYLRSLYKRVDNVLTQNDLI